MSLNRICVPLHAGLKEMWIDGPETHHMLHVKRLGSGDRIVLFDGMGKEYDAEIVEISDNKVKVKICQIKTVNKENNVEIDIAFAI